MGGLRIAVLHNVDFESYAEGASSLEADAGVRDTAEAVRDALIRLGHEASMVTIDDDLEALTRTFDRSPSDVVFNLVESIGGEASREPEVPERLESLGVPYTGNSGAALRAALAKDSARARLEACGVPLPRGVVVERGARVAGARALGLAYPLFVKPARTDASIGIDQGSIVRDDLALEARLAHLSRTLDGPYLVEEYLPGKEVNVALFPEPERGHRVATEIDFSEYGEGLAPIVTYDCKWRPGTPDYAARSVPSRGRSSEREIEEALDIARRAFLALQGTGYGRVDLRQGADGRFRAIDVNPNPDIHPEAGLAIAARSVGIEYDALVESVVRRALGETVRR